MSRARMRAGGSVSAVAALALSAMGLAALPASAEETDELTKPASSQEQTTTSGEVDETSTTKDSTEPSEQSDATEEDDAEADADAPSDDAADSTDHDADAESDEPTEGASTDDGTEPSNAETAEIAALDESPEPQAEDDPITLDIIAISDFHGHLENAPQLDNMVKAIEADNPDYTGFVGNGDLVGGSAYVSAIAEDVPTHWACRTLRPETMSSIKVTGILKIELFRHLTIRTPPPMFRAWMLTPKLSRMLLRPMVREILRLRSLMWVPSPISCPLSCHRVVSTG